MTMQNNTETVLNILMSDKTIAETLNKIISGQYVTDRERKRRYESCNRPLV